METKISNAQQRRLNKIKIITYIYRQGETSKQEIAEQLGLSMPTVLQRVKELLEEGIIAESGEYESTGGRKAKVLTVSPMVRCAAGMDITRNHVSFVYLNAKGELLAKKRLRFAYRNEESYYEALGAELETFLKECPGEKSRILGVGISVPGIVDTERNRMPQSHVLELEDFDLKRFTKYVPYRTRFSNDANSAAYAELRGTDRNTIYLSLSNTVGGAVYMNGEIYQGDHFRSGEFGHMLLIPGGRPCYCGKKGCLDSYCSARAVAAECGDDLEAFFEGLERQDEHLWEVWREYLEHLAIAISNLRMAFDCDVILGGYVGGFMEPYLPLLEEKLAGYRIFERDGGYVKTGRYKHEAAATGAALRFVEHFFASLT